MNLNKLHVSKIILIVFLFLIPSPYTFFTLPIENWYSFFSLLSIFIICFRTKNLGVLLLVFLLVLKFYSIVSQENIYSLCYKNIEESQNNNCIETFTQYSLLTKSNQIYQFEVNEGVDSFQKTYYGHSDSSWKTQYLTNVNNKNGAYSPSAAENSWNYNWIPFKVEISKNFNEPTVLKIDYFGELKIVNNDNVIFSDKNYDFIKSEEIEIISPDLKVYYQYLPEDKDIFTLNKISDFEIKEKYHFATLKINDLNSNDNLQIYIFWIIILFLVLNLTTNKNFYKIYRFVRNLIILLFLNVIIYYFVQNQIITTVILCLIISILKYFDKEKLLYFSLLFLPMNVLKLFDISSFKLPRVPGTVPQHHQSAALTMNIDPSFSNYLKGADNLFYEPPLFRYLLNFINFIFGDNWKLVVIIFLWTTYYLLNKLLDKKVKDIFFFFIVLLLFSSSAFLTLLMNGWSEPFNFLILIYAVCSYLQNNNINAGFILCASMSILLRPEGILYLFPLTVFLIYKSNLKSKKSLLPLVILLFPLLHNFYFGGEIYLLSSTGNELGFSSILSKDGSVPIEQTLDKFNLSKLKAIFFIPFSQQSLNYVGNGFLFTNLILIMYVVYDLLIKKLNAQIYFAILFLSFAPFFIYDIFDGYPRRALSLIICCILIFLINNYKHNNFHLNKSDQVNLEL